MNNDILNKHDDGTPAEGEWEVLGPTGNRHKAFVASYAPVGISRSSTTPPAAPSRK